MTATSLAPPAVDLPIPAGPRCRAQLASQRPGGSVGPQEAAELLLTGSQAGTPVPDGPAVAQVVLAGPRALAGLAGATLGTDPAATATALVELAERWQASARLLVADAIALRCDQLGVGKVYAYPGTSELALCAAFATWAPGSLINARGDQEAAFMAGGAQLRDRRALRAAAILHGARGLISALGAIADLRRNEVPALALVGMPSTSSAPFLPPHGEDELLVHAAGFAKAALELTEPGDVVAHLDSAITTALALPRGPVLVGIAQDVGEAPLGRLAQLAQPFVPQPPAPAPPEALRRAASLLTGAQRPVILVDDYLFHHAGGVEALAAFAHQLSAPIFQLRYRRGPMLFQQLTAATMPFAGHYDHATPAHRDLLGAADVLVTVEDRNAYERVVGPLPTCPRVAITANPDITVRNTPTHVDEVLLAGDPPRLLAALTPAVVRAPRHGAEPARPATTGPPPAGELVGDGVKARLQQLLGALVRGCIEHTGATTVVDDSQIAGGLLAEAYHDVFAEGVTVVGDHGGFVGAGLALAAGHAITHDQAVVCLLGDQGFTNGGAQALVAATQQAARLLVLVLNNGESVSLRTQATATIAADLPEDLDRLLRNPPGYDYVAAAGATGACGVDVSLTPHDPIVALAGDEVDEALRAIAVAWASGSAGPVLVEVGLPSQPDAWQGVWAVAGLDDPPSPATGPPAPLPAGAVTFGGRR